LKIRLQIVASSPFGKQEAIQLFTIQGIWILNQFVHTASLKLIDCFLAGDNEIGMCVGTKNVYIHVCTAIALS